MPRQERKFPVAPIEIRKLAKWGRRVIEPIRMGRTEVDGFAWNE